MTLNCNGKLIDTSTPKVMGILNLTPNSFYDGGKYTTENLILNQVEKMLLEGATFIDVGGYSSKPNAEFVSEIEELNRVLPVIKVILKHFPEAILSIDSFRSEVAKQCLDVGVALVNDISAGNLDNKMLETVAQYNVPYCMMHTKGTPQTMMQQTSYDDLVKDILFYFSEKLQEARSLGINDCIVDVGFGFAKTTEQNFELLHKLDLFKTLQVPLLVGVSRKSMIYKTLQISPAEALNGTTVLHTIALQKGANILRVHEVKEAVETIKLVSKVKAYTS